MNTQANKLLHLPLLVGGIAAILVSGIAIGSLAISAQGFNRIPAPAESPAAIAAPAMTCTRSPCLHLAGWASVITRLDPSRRRIVIS